MDHTAFGDFLISVNKWISHLISGSYLSTEHPDPLWQDICHKTLHENQRTKDWMLLTRSADTDIKSLLYRYYLVGEATQIEVLPTVDFAPLYVLMASVLTRQIVFSPFCDAALWDGLDTSVHPINLLRARRPLIHTYVQHIAMRDDETDRHVIRDHGSLSSLALMYGLHLIRVTVIREITLYPDPGLNEILESLGNTLVNLKGVFGNVESQWQLPHVR